MPFTCNNAASYFAIAALIAFAREAAAEHAPLAAGMQALQPAARQLRAGPGARELRSELHQAVDAVLGQGLEANRAEMLKIQERFSPLWNALAKNSDGRIDRRSLRYALHRYFMSAYSLSLVGLEPSQAATSSEAALLAAHAPAYVRDLLEGQASGSGFSLQDTAAIVAVLERLVADSGHHTLEAACRSAGLDPELALSWDDLDGVLQRYLLRWLLSDDWHAVQMLEDNVSLRRESFENWSELVSFLQGQVKAFEFKHRAVPKGARSAWSPLKQRFSLSDAQEVVGSITTSFGSFWETECRRVKASLTQMDGGHTGRVKLSAFHNAALNGEWRFSESTDYLRQLGALDETSSYLGPRVIIVNYMQAASNCIVSHQHYRVCCANECEELLREVEASVNSPVATPEMILPVVRNMSADLDAPRGLQASLVTQLDEIARVNSGRIPLHGRLFAQWLHYAFPLECPFPHKAGTTIAMTPSEYGGGFLATDDELETNAADNQSQAPTYVGCFENTHEDSIKDHVLQVEARQTVALCAAAAARHRALFFGLERSEDGTSSCLVLDTVPPTKAASRSECDAAVGSDGPLGGPGRLAVYSTQAGLAELPGSAGATASIGQDEWMSQWSKEEELVTDMHLQAPWDTHFPVGTLFVLAALAAAAAALAKGSLGSQGLSRTGGRDLLPLASRVPKAHLI